MERTKTYKIGVLALQGDISEHIDILELALKKKELHGAVLKVLTREDLDGIDGLVIPGGESTTISKLLISTGMYDRMREIILEGVPVLGTCAGLVLLSTKGCAEVEKTGQPLLRGIDVKVERNAFGRQRESFETDIDIPSLGIRGYRAVFIRAPCISHTDEGIEVLARYEGRIIAARRDNVIVLSFHPELSDDTRIHEYFLETVRKRKEEKNDQ